MVLCTEIIKKVDIPESLPPLEQMTRLEGNVILKNVVAENDGLRVTGDLLWRGFFPLEMGSEECLWEGAEFFSHLVDLGALRNSDTFLLDPKVTSLQGESVNDGSCRLTFSILWAEADVSDDSPLAEECACTPQAPREYGYRQEEEASAFYGGDEDTFAAAPIPETAIEPAPDFLQLEDSYEEIANQWSDTLDILKAEESLAAFGEEEENIATGNQQGKGLVMEIEPVESNESAGEPAVDNGTEILREPEPKVEAAEAVIEEEDEIPQPPVSADPGRKEVGAIKYSETLTTMEPLLSEPFKLRYYRVQWGEDLSAIAERLSASIAKIKEINTIEEEDIKVGTVLRIP